MQHPRGNFFPNPQAPGAVPRGAAGMDHPSPSVPGLSGILVFLLLSSAAPCPAWDPGGGPASHPPVPAGSLRAEASTVDGLSAGLDLSAGASRLSARLSAEPGTAPSLEIGGSGPLWAAGPVRHQGLARVLDDPGADAYLFTGAWQKPLALDFDSSSFGAFLGREAGFWIQDAREPRMGLWAGTTGDRGIVAGAAFAGSLLPAEAGFDPWFSEDPARPARLLAAGAVWGGYRFRDGMALACAALSEEDRGDRGWAVRAEWELSAKNFLWSGRLSGSSPGWKGLGGEGADAWEVRTDALWTLRPRFRLEGRLRAGADPDGNPDWEALARASRSGPRGRWGLELAGSDAESDPPLRLEPALWAGYEGRAVRAAARMSQVREGLVLTRTEVSASLGLGRPSLPELRLEGARRWTPEGPCWKAGAALEIPASRGAWTVRAGTPGWTPDSAPLPWELAFSLRSRFP